MSNFTMLAMPRLFDAPHYANHKTHRGLILTAKGPALTPAKPLAGSARLGTGQA